MHSFLLSGPDEIKQEKYIEDFCKEKKIGKFDESIFEPLEKSFGIEDVRLLQKAANLKPKNGTEKVLIIRKAELLTIDAQNALLKLLEEPPTGTYIFLCAHSLSSFLPTILSRCKVISLGEKEIISTERKKEIANTLQQIEQGSTAEKLYLAEKLAAEKELLSDWLIDAIDVAREEMLIYPEKQKTILLEELQKAYRLVKTTNVTARIILEHTFLSL